MSVKDPQHYGPCGLKGPQPPVVESPSRNDQPAPGSFRAIMSVKDPQNYGPRSTKWAKATDTTADKCHRPSPGSWEAIMSVKDPQHYGPCGKKDFDRR
ncbi:MAG: hypothetical protein E6R07_07530 [Nevskiaceae bacterium]|nr:MAG: hypothetical protein E6R07_07530 [Nevskiaceae bacterium]